MCWWNDMDDDLRACTDVWRELHPMDYNPLDLEDPWGHADDAWNDDNDNDDDDDWC